MDVDKYTVLHFRLKYENFFAIYVTRTYAQSFKQTILTQKLYTEWETLHHISIKMRHWLWFVLAFKFDSNG